MTEKTAAKILAKYLRKGNLARCMRDFLPSKPTEDGERVSAMVHDAIRWKRLYDSMLDDNSEERSAENYIRLAAGKAQDKPGARPFEVANSFSDYMAFHVKKHPGWADRLNQPPSTTLCVNFNICTMHDVMAELKREQLPASKSKIETAVLTSSSARYSTVIKNNLAHVQDESGQLIAAIAISLGKSVFDYCAGNGGKSITMASLCRNKKMMHANDASPTRLAVMETRCRDYRANIATITPSHMKFDVVLVDVPSTGTGVARRNPQAKYISGPGDFPARQLQVLKEASERVGPGGFIIYSACSFLPEETDSVIEHFLKGSGFGVVPLEDLPFKELFEKSTHGAFTNVPGGDIFYVSVLRKVRETFMPNPR